MQLHNFVILPSPELTWRRSEITLSCLTDIWGCWCPMRKGWIPWETKKTSLPVKSYWSRLQQNVLISLLLLVHGWKEYPKSTCSSLEGFICTSSQTSMEWGSRASSVQYSTLLKERGIQRKQERSLKGKERKNKVQRQKDELINFQCCTLERETY